MTNLHVTEGNSFGLRATISPDLNAALEQMAAATGVAKATLVRHALTKMLAEAGVVVPSAVEDLPLTRTRGALASTKRKEQR